MMVTNQHLRRNALTHLLQVLDIQPPAILNLLLPLNLFAQQTWRVWNLKAQEALLRLRMTVMKLHIQDMQAIRTENFVEITSPHFLQFLLSNRSPGHHTPMSTLRVSQGWWVLQARTMNASITVTPQFPHRPRAMVINPRLIHTHPRRAILCTIPLGIPYLRRRRHLHRLCLDILAIHLTIQNIIILLDRMTSIIVNMQPHLRSLRVFPRALVEDRRRLLTTPNVHHAPFLPLESATLEIRVQPPGQSTDHPAE